MSHDHFDELATGQFNKSIAGPEMFFAAIVERIAIFRALEVDHGVILKIADELDNRGRLTLGLGKTARERSVAASTCGIRRNSVLIDQ
jgi:hypothetical protein